MSREAHLVDHYANDTAKETTPKKETAPAKKTEDKKETKSTSTVHGYSVGLDFTVNASHMYGIPQRNDNFRLEETGFDHPYRLFN